MAFKYIHSPTPPPVPALLPMAIAPPLPLPAPPANDDPTASTPTRTHTRTRGTTAIISYMECAESGCTFQGRQCSSSKKRVAVDEAVCTHPKTGMKFRWKFIAKSHLKCETKVRVEGRNPFTAGFGCLFCADERKFGGMGTTLRHARARSIGATVDTTKSAVAMLVLMGVDALLNHILKEQSDSMTPSTCAARKVLLGAEGGKDDEFDLNTSREGIQGA